MTCLIGISTLLVSACSQTENMAKPVVAATDTIQTQATVIAINRPEREVVLRGQDGTTMGYALDERVRNFDQIEVGDVVTAQYYESIAIAVEPATGKPTIKDTSSDQRAPLGDKPEANNLRIRELTAMVEDIDYSNRLVTLRGPSGQIRKVKVGPDVTNLEAVRRGDQVRVRHTEAIAVAVTE
ncbi:hypothetical protein N825_00325 [Skermanella stibiiresistens SB22]|uniref:Uncharacterized protein n=2 Tax=Skermanella TaxID=204447 RepID=W9HDL1_9PROT|nr:hypothetical protein N825_00325 [Skermanella stibiiresistens SB22]